MGIRATNPDLVRRRTVRTLVRLAAGLLLASLAACLSSTERPTPRSAEADVLAAYREYFDTYVAVGESPDPSDARLAQAATGRALRQFRADMRELQRAGLTIERGDGFKIDPTIRTATRRRVTIEDCPEEALIIRDAEGRDVTGNPTVEPVRFTLVRDAGTWKLRSIDPGSGSCGG